MVLLYLLALPLRPLVAAVQTFLSIPVVRAWGNAALAAGRGLARGWDRAASAPAAAVVQNVLAGFLASCVVLAAVGWASAVMETEMAFDLVGTACFVLVAGGGLGLGAARKVAEGAAFAGGGGLVDGARAVVVGSGGAATKASIWGLIKAFPAVVRDPEVRLDVEWRQVLVSGMVIVWAVRLGWYTFTRSLRNGGDWRFKDIRTDSWRLFRAFMMQSVWVVACTLPVVVLNSVPRAVVAQSLSLRAERAVQLNNYVMRLVMLPLGVHTFARGFAIEVVADWQMMKWARERELKKHNEGFCKRGLWDRSRHPNYYGEIMLWFGIGTTCGSVLFAPEVRAELGIGLIPMLVLCYIPTYFAYYLVMKATGAPLVEKRLTRKLKDRKDYRRWKVSTPRLILWEKKGVWL